MNNENDHIDQKNEELDLFDIFSLLINKKAVIILVTLLFSFIGIGYSLSIPNIYKSTAVLSSTSSLDSLSNMSNRYSNIANIAGISLPSSGETDRVAESIELLKSYNFFESFIQEYDFFKEIVAVKGWDGSSNTLIYDDKIYDEGLMKWVSDKPFALQGKPSNQFAYRKFLKNLSVIKNEKTNFVIISYEHHSPFYAKEIVEKIILQLNNSQRNEDILIAKKSISFLNNELKNTEYINMQGLVNALIQKELENIMLANVEEEYLFNILSKPIAPETKYSPQRAMICIIFFIIGFVLSCTYVLVYSFRINPDAESKYE